MYQPYRLQIAYMVCLCLYLYPLLFHLKWDYSHFWINTLSIREIKQCYACSQYYYADDSVYRHYRAI